jgi:hypothetical protein
MAQNLGQEIEHIHAPRNTSGLFYQVDKLPGLGQVRGNRLARGFVLPGNLVRLQVVQQESNPVFWRLLKRFGEQAPAPLLVNTSFNLFGEPLVVRPRDAVRSYFCTGIDALVIDNFVLSKTSAMVLPLAMDPPKAASA